MNDHIPESPSIDFNTSVSICICTFKRTNLLDSLLAGLQLQSVGSAHVEIVVTDNDPEMSAAPVLNHWVSRSRFPMITRHESAPNISIARNSCVNASSHDWIAFIDDDEIPHQNWLANLLVAQHNYEADVVFGPVIPMFPITTPNWILEGQYFDRRRHKTGTPVSLGDARTGNALVRKSLLHHEPQPFDPRYGQTGGEDTVLFSKLMSLGTKMIWCDEALVSEHVHQSRLTFKWLLMRSLRSGQSWLYSQAHTVQPPMQLKRWHIAWVSLRAIGYSILAAFLLAPFSRPRAIRQLRTAAYNFGIVSALLGHKYFEYSSK